MDLKYDVVIIGAGLSGLMCASILSNRGLKVCVLDKNPNIGGTIQAFKRNGFFFDTGMHFFGAVSEGQIQNNIFKIAGLSDIIKLSLIDKEISIYIDNERIDIPLNIERYKNILLKLFPSESVAIDKYFSKINEINNLLNIESIYEINDKLEYLQTGIDDFLNSITDNLKLKKILKFNEILYYGNSGQTSLYLHAVITGSFFLSMAEFKYGSNDFLSRIRSKIIESSSSIETRKYVIDYKISENKVFECITADGHSYRADNFIFTAHPQNLVNNSGISLLHKPLIKRIFNTKNSPGAFSIYLLLKKNAFKKPDSPIFFNSLDPKFKSILLFAPVANSHNGYANTLKIMTLMNITELPDYKPNSDYLRNDLYMNFKNEIAENMIKYIQSLIPELKNCIDHYYTSTPLTIRNFTGSVDGSAYGIIHDYNNYIYSMIPVKTKLQNLFLSGQNINFHGMLGVSITALHTCSAILNEKIYN